jgi:F-box domain
VIRPPKLGSSRISAQLYRFSPRFGTVRVFAFGAAVPPWHRPRGWPLSRGKSNLRSFRTASRGTKHETLADLVARPVAWLVARLGKGSPLGLPAWVADEMGTLLPFSTTHSPSTQAPPTHSAASTETGAQAKSRQLVSQLTPDAVFSIFTYLSPKDRFALASVCWHFREVVKSDTCWRTVLPPIVADHSEPLHTQAQQVRDASRTSPFRRIRDDAVVSFPSSLEMTAESGHVRVSVPPGNDSGAHMPAGTEKNMYWSRYSSSSGASILFLQLVCWLHVVTTFKHLPAGSHTLAWNVKFFRPVVLHFRCEVKSAGGLTKSNMTLQADSQQLYRQADETLERLRDGSLHWLRLYLA